MYMRIGLLLALVMMSSGFGITHAEATSDVITEKMLNSTVCIECRIQFQGEIITGGSGSGFLIANSEYVITNHHVIEDCHPDNKRLFLQKRYMKKYYDKFVAGKLKMPSKYAALMKNKSKKQKENILLAWLGDLAVRTANQNYSDISQDLYIMVMGKEGQEPIRVDVSSIAWASIKKTQKKAHDIGTDLAILMLSRPLSNRPSVTFATGASAKVNDPVYTVGYPGASGRPVPSAKYIPTLKKGVVSKLGGASRITEDAEAKGLKGVAVIETDAAINPGNSGGPLYNEYGEVLGINTFRPNSRFASTGIGWAQDISVVIPVLKDLGLPMPPIREKRHTWVEKNTILVKIGGGVIALVLISGALLMFLKQNKKAPAPTEAPKGRSPQPKETIKAAAVSANPAIKGRNGQFSGVKIPIPAGGLMLGRREQEAGWLGFNDDDMSVSRQHCKVLYDPASRQFEVTDLGSSNGTFLLPEGKKMAAQQKVVCPVGKVIRIGNNSEFELTLQ